MKRILAFVFVMAAASTADAFSVSRTDSHHLVKWYLDDSKIVIHIDSNGPKHLASGYTQDDVDAAVQRAVDSWNDVSCSAIHLSIGSSVSDTTPNVVSATDSDDLNATLDDTNIVTWIRDASRYPFDASVLGVTSPVFYQDGTIIEADVALNDVDVTWAVYDDLSDVSGGSTETSGIEDVESVVVHELGHLIGLGHVLDGASMSDPPTMTPTVDPELRTRTLTTNDEDGACFLYPSDENTDHTCETDDNCPEFISSTSDGDSSEEEIVATSACSNGTCTKIEDVQCGSGNAGERCCTNNCDDDLTCVRLATQTDMAYCAASCDTSEENCDDGYVCAQYGDDADEGVCISESITGCDCDDNDSCDSSCACDTDCNSDGTGGTGSDDDDYGGCNALGGESLVALFCGLLLLRRVRSR